MPKKDMSRAMKLDDFIEQSMKKLVNSNDLEIPIGIVKILKYGARIAPSLFLKIVNKKR
jgi:hypothetical protein